ncbi:DoxX family protein [Hymenobacter arizonensis]|uniref:Uncharacterized membrane protein n=1 Tax=Hymenobacter arizonensis TaxID=1227077 RepID=A0A1I5SJG2_HYMAR|nr:DoxX family protein [Hymenobacter arizonensis]SFP70900.1 Uncharacterized membrane protein [Hymenobacter arizonensis]
MKPLIVLLAAFGLIFGATYLLRGSPNFLLAGNGAMAAMLLFTGAGHFAFAQGMAQMLPAWLPYRRGWVYVTGVLEIAAAIGLLWPVTRAITGWALLIFFVAVLPANINAARQHLDYQRGDATGPGPRYLWFRVPLQLLFLAWTWYFALYRY